MGKKKNSKPKNTGDAAPSEAATTAEPREEVAPKPKEKSKEEQSAQDKGNVLQNVRGFIGSTIIEPCYNIWVSIVIIKRIRNCQIRYCVAITIKVSNERMVFGTYRRKNPTFHVNVIGKFKIILNPIVFFRRIRLIEKTKIL